MSWLEEYKKWVVKHSDILSQVETLGRISSYLIAGRIKKSPAFSEFLYSATNIIVFLNDQIILSASQPNNVTNVSPSIMGKAHVFITTVDYLQVFLEIAGQKVWGIHGKWIVITIIQITKFLWRIVVLLQQRAGLATVRPIPPLNRKDLKQQSSISHSNKERVTDTQDEACRHYPSAFMLQSGRVIRKVSGAPLIHNRNWKPPVIPESERITNTKLEGYCLVGEAIYAAKPLLHLTAMGRWGSSSWLPWLLALGMDVTSLKLLQSGPALNAEDGKELHRRQLMLLMYLLRSPFYDRFSRNVLTVTLAKLSRFPLIGVLPQHLLQYLPYWQQLYSYTWE